MSVDKEHPPIHEHSHFRWSPIVARPQFRWPSRAHLARSAIISLQCFETDPPPRSHQSRILAGGLGLRPYPDYPMLSYREYGHRVGFFRLVSVLERHSWKPTIAMDVMTAERYPYLVRFCIERGYEIIAHGLSASQIVTSAMSIGEERHYVKHVLKRMHEATGLKVRGWMSPEYSESSNTPQILAENGVRFVCDWANDEQPYRMMPAKGELYSLPVALECDDSVALGLNRVTLSTYRERIVTTCRRLILDGRLIPRSFVLVLHPWLVGQPSRVRALEWALAEMAGWTDVVTGSAGEIVDWYAAAVQAVAPST